MDLCENCAKRVARRMREAERREGSTGGDVARGMLLQTDSGAFVVKAATFGADEWPELSR